MRALLVLALALVACGDGDDSGPCACTISIDDASAKLELTCGQQGCIGGYGYGCDNDDVVQLGACDPDLATPPVENDAGVPLCLAARADCTNATLPCCTTEPGVAPTCDPTTLLCCVVTGSTCTTASDCCNGHSCVPLGGKNVCGS